MEWIYFIGVPFVLSALFTPFLKWIAVKLNIYAEMNERTIHTRPIARIGGVSIFVAFITSLAMFTKVDASLNGIILGGFIMFLGGLIDDMLTLKPSHKFAFQVVAAIVTIVIGGVSLNRISLPFGIEINMGLISFVVTFFWITGITNAINLIDGLDGLAGGISVIILVVIASLSVVEGRGDVQVLSLVLAGATLGFLLFNSHPASIFMGDCGALFLGFTISAISLLGFKSSTIITLALPILMCAIPIIDTISAILRRLLSGKKFSEADKNHLHHVLMRRFGHRNAVLILYAVTALFGVSAYIYIVNKTIGFLVMLCIAIGVELFIEISGMISPQYHPLISMYEVMRGKSKDACEEFLEENKLTVDTCSIEENKKENESLKNT